MIKQLINDEKFTNIQKAQAGLTRLFLEAEKTGSFYRVLKNDQSLGVLLPDRLWQSLVEDLEALSSPNFRQKIAKARKEKKTIKASEVKKQLGL
jgi:PHD/YefM family antitoxin component YafN of YafNO toxin-antitoxin module